MKLNDIRDNPGARTPRLRIGRGIGSGKGKTGGRGGKGQTARTGVSLNGFEGGQTPLYRRMPKRGFRNTAFQMNWVEVNLDTLQSAIDGGKLAIAGKIDAEAMVKAGVVRRTRDGIRLLGNGVDAFKSKIAIEVSGASKSAVAAVEKAGGSVSFLKLERDGAVKDAEAKRAKTAKKKAPAPKQAPAKKAEG
jgi:large subunit ribosomal protein L15